MLSGEHFLKSLYSKVRMFSLFEKSEAWCPHFAHHLRMEQQTPALELADPVSYPVPLPLTAP